MKGLSNLPFGEALELVKTGTVMMLPHWLGEYVGVVFSDSNIGKPYLFKRINGEEVEWLPNMDEILSENWTVVQK